MTAPTYVPGGSRALAVALLIGVAAVVGGGVVAALVLVPSHKGSPHAMRPTVVPSSGAGSTAPSSPNPSVSSTVPDSPAAIASLGGLVIPPGDPQAALKTAIAAAFVRYTDVVNDMSTTKTEDFAPLTQVAADPLYTAIEEGIVKLYTNDEIEQGRVALSSLSVEHIGSDGQSATLTACADLAGTHTVNAKTGQPVGSPGSPRIVDAATLRVTDGSWKVTGLTHPGVC